MEKILEVKNLNYRDWKNINLSFEKGQIYYITGGNSSGKTTLFKLMSGLIKTSNCILCDNIYYNEINRSSYITKIGIVRRVNNHSFIYKNVIDEMTYPLYNLNFRKNAIESRIDDLLSFFEMDYLRKKSIVELNIYEKQILLIIISLLHYPKVLLLDNALDLLREDERKKIINKLKLLTEKGLCVINFTSNLEDALMGDKIIIINEFKVMQEVLPSEMFNDDKIFYENDLEIPFICDLNIKLKMYKMIDKNYIDMKELVDSIWQ